MTGLSMFEKAMSMLGYVTVEEISGRDVMLKKAITFINLIYTELYYAFVGENFKPIKSLNEKIDLPDKVLNDIFPYGLAMYLAQSECDADNQQLFANLYNQKRNRATKIQKVKDRLPKIWG